MTTPHNHQVCFGRKVSGCPRCDEIKAGSPVVKWSKARQADKDAAFRAALMAHDCGKARCGPVCTFGDW
jgi:hypothetical protein